MRIHHHREQSLPLKGAVQDQPIRDVILSLEGLEQHAKENARLYVVSSTPPRSQPLLQRLEEDYRILKSAHRVLTETVQLREPITPASQWLLDNFYLIQDEVRVIQKGLPKRYYRELPRLIAEPLRGYPRVYAMALDFVAHTDSQLDETRLSRFVKAYQTESRLSSAELWAFAIMLRVVLVQNIRRLGSQAVIDQRQREQADKWADLLLAVAAKSTEKLNQALAEHDRSVRDLDPAYAVQLLRRLRDQGPAAVHIVDWMDERLARQGVTSDDLIRTVHQTEAINLVSIGNCVKSLRFLSSLDWSEFFESTSQLEEVLRQDPAGVYSRMDFVTRDRYRHEVEQLAKASGIVESHVARHAIQYAMQASESNTLPAKQQHVGYYLLDKGLRQLEDRLGMRGPGLLSRSLRWFADHPTPLYLTSVALAIATVIGLVTVCARDLAGSLSAGELRLLIVLILLPASDVALHSINWLATRCFHPQFLPKLELKEGLPAEFRTLVVVPSMLTNEERVHQLVDQLEVHYLANQEENLHFAVLSDFADAPQKEMPGDQALLDLAIREVEALNEQYSNGRNDLFYLLHREQQWNPGQGKWMGWERKRGKLEELNRLLRGDQDTSFVVHTGEPSILPLVRFVITLDADTQLPRDTAKRLIGTLAHPLNQPVLNADSTRVVEGYGVLQPRVATTMTSSSRSLFALTFAGQTGVDPYPTAVSDVYQDIFKESIYMGKGIYDVDAFRTVVDGRIPENSVLSHDLLEGSYVRSGMVSDIELVDGFPALYSAYASRMHRWVRGDWQLLPWLLPYLRDASGRWVRNPLTLISKWRMVDNLRRSLMAPAMMILIAAGVLVLPGGPWFWLGFVALTLAFPIVTHLAEAVLTTFRGSLFGGRFRWVLSDLRTIIYQTMLSATFLPHQAYLMVDAILRTVVRVVFTRKNLMKWETAADAERRLQSDLTSVIRQMWPALAQALALTAAMILTKPVCLLPMAPLLILWILSPVIVYAVSQSRRPRLLPLAQEDRKHLGQLADKTWRYFDELVGEEDHYLPPDNYQEDLESPLGEVQGKVAHRTSPTNIGLYLLSILAAKDLEFITITDALDRLEQTLSSLEQMSRHDGHFYNWYDTRTLAPLEPLYLSTVDSGNLVGSLLTLKQGLEEILDSPVSTLELALKTKKVMRDGEKASSVEETETAEAVEHLLERCRKLVTGFEAMVVNTDFKPLYDFKRNLFFIGYNVTAGQRDNAYYDLLASEARLGSFVAIAKGDVPVKHWFRLSRKLIQTGSFRALLSWSGTMFEYLMPLLVMHNYDNTLLDETYTAVVKYQQEYAAGFGIPWGVSESGFYAFSDQLDYQYQAFGVPGLGLKRGLSEDRVIAPYSTLLAMAIDPVAALKNLHALKLEGMEGRFGFYDAVDFTPDRLPPGERRSIVRCFMAHHQGMSLLAIDNALNDNVMRRRFHSEARVQATELLLQERIPRRTELAEHPHAEEAALRVTTSVELPIAREFDTPHTSSPEAHILSNSAYTVVLTATGAGFSRFKGRAITRWHEDPTRDSWGTFFYIRDLETDAIWSPTYQPIDTGKTERPSKSDRYHVTFSPDRADFWRREGDLESRMEVAVSAEHNAEVRRISLKNRGRSDKLLDLTSYLEVVLASPQDDLAHPAFSNLFVETEYIEGKDALLATRRPRSSEEKRDYLIHVLALEGGSSGELQFETDRARFIGRGRTLAAPVAMQQDQQLSRTTGAVLDPILSLRTHIRLTPGATVRVSFTTAVADSREKALHLIDVYHDAPAADRAFILAWTHAQVELRYLNLTSGKAHLLQRLASRLLYQHPSLRAKADFIERNHRGTSGLWALGLSGDFPILLVRIGDEDEFDLLRDAVRAHEYLRLKDLPMDLVILNDHPSGYIHLLQDKIRELIRASHAHSLEDHPGGVFLRQADLLSEEDKMLLQAVARVTLVGSSGSLETQLDQKILETPLPKKIRLRRPTEIPAVPLGERGELAFFNGLGGFTPDGQEYIIHLKDDQQTPAPWINVVSNPRLGFLVSESGSSYTWAENSRENKLTPWSNDPVTDTPGEVLYLRDEETGEVWTPTPLPVREGEPYTIRHGHGYTVFEHGSHGLRQELTLFVPTDCPVKICRLRVTNHHQRRQSLSATYYVEWTLGVHPQSSRQQIVTDVDLESGVLTARNVFREGFAGRLAFLDAVGIPTRTFTADRTEFIGRNGNLSAPAALSNVELSGRKGAGYDPCGAVQVKWSLDPGETQEVLFVLGEAESLEEVRSLVYRFRAPGAVEAALMPVWNFWNQVLETVQISTPEPSFNLMINRWLLYQTLSCRLWARSAFYQCGGAYGYRDQLQDVMALIHVTPDEVRQHLLRAAGRQYQEGDVQHWWHPPTGLGVRTRCSDDYLWLPFVTAHYVACTGDSSILDESIPYLHDKPLEVQEQDRCNVSREILTREKHSIGIAFDHWKGQVTT